MLALNELSQAQDDGLKPDKKVRESFLLTFLKFLQANPDIRNTLVAMIFGAAVFMFIMNLHKLTQPDENEQIAQEAKDELKLLGPFKLISQGGKDALSSD